MSRRRPLVLERLDRSDPGSLWLATDPLRLNELRRLGRRADELAARDVLASPAEALRVLRDALDRDPNAQRLSAPAAGPAEPPAPLDPLQRSLGYRGREGHRR